MAVYKVIQDIEAEDKLLGPLTLKQFIFAAIAAGFIFVAFVTVSKTGTLLAAIPFLPFIAVPAILAAPIGKDQPTDIWLAARIRFLIKPRKRIWDQSGIKELVTITVPKHIEKHYTDGLSQTEVQSRLKALAETIDSRGWAVKNVDLNMSLAPAYAGNSYDRLIDPASLPQSVPISDISAADDIMDATSNPVAQHFDQLVKDASIAQRAAAVASMHSVPQNKPSQQTPIDPWFMHQPNPGDIPAGPNAAMFTAQTVAPAAANPQAAVDDGFLTPQAAEPTPQEQELLQHLKADKKQAPYPYNGAHHKTIKTPADIAAEAAAKAKQAKIQQAQAVTPPKNPDIVELANTNDLSVASVAHMANRNNSQEVVINLH